MFLQILCYTRCDETDSAEKETTGNVCSSIPDNWRISYFIFNSFKTTVPNVNKCLLQIILQNLHLRKSQSHSLLKSQL